MTDTQSRRTPREVAAATPGVIRALDAVDPSQPLIARVAEALVSGVRSGDTDQQRVANISIRLTVEGKEPAHLTATRVAEALRTDADEETIIQVQIARIV